MPAANVASETSPLLQDQENGDHEDRQVYPPESQISVPADTPLVARILEGRQLKSQEFGQLGQSWRTLPLLHQCRVCDHHRMQLPDF